MGRPPRPSIAHRADGSGEPPPVGRNTRLPKAAFTPELAGGQRFCAAARPSTSRLINITGPGVWCRVLEFTLWFCVERCDWQPFVDRSDRVVEPGSSLQLEDYHHQGGFLPKHWIWSEPPVITARWRHLICAALECGI